MSIVQRLITAYKLWHEFLPNMPKVSRFTIGEKIDGLFLDTIEASYMANYAQRNLKVPHLHKASGKLDLVKLFLQIAWEAKALESNKYISLSQELDEIGRMLGAWLRKMEGQQPSISTK